MKKRFLMCVVTVLMVLLLAVLLTVGASAAETEIENDDGLRIGYGNLVFKDTIYLRYAVSTETYSADDMVLLVWTEAQDGAGAYAYGTQDLVLTASGTTSIEGVTHAVFDYKGLTAKQMTDYIYARAYVLADGNTPAKYGKTVKYSVLQYSYSLLGKTGTSGTTDEKLINLINAMLNYGAAAQEYTAYKTDWLANDEYYLVEIKGGHFKDGFAQGLFRPGHKEEVVSHLTGEHIEIEVSSENTEVVLPTYSEGLSYVSNGDGTCYVSGIGTCTDTDVIIPAVSPAGDKVTSIGSEAFAFCTGLTSITIPDSMTSIGSWAFYRCSSLTSVTIPDSVTSIGYQAFYGCTGLTSITISDSVTSIDDYTFQGCTGLTSITIPNSVTSIGYEAFDGCSSLTSVTIGNGVTSIDARAFYDCTELIEINFNATNCQVLLGRMNDGYANCVFFNAGINGTGITVTFGDNVQYIPAELFLPYSYPSLYDPNIKSVIIGNSVTSIGAYAFYGCTTLTDVYYTGTAEKWATINIGTYNDHLLNATIHYNYKTPSQGLAFTSNGDGTCYVSGIGSCTDADVIIPAVSPAGDKVTSIGPFAFYGCSGLASITIPEGVTSIGDEAFSHCSGVTSIVIPDSVSSIGCEAFSYCSALTDVMIPQGVTSIYAAFEGCISLTSITIPDSVTNISLAFHGCTSLTSITIPDSVTDISFAFHGCTGLTSITIPDSVTDISFAFHGCTGLTSVNFAENSQLTRIGNYAFRGCTDLKNITIPKSVTSIDFCAFDACTGLTSITISDSVTNIGNEVFYGCTNLKNVTYGGTAEKWATINIGEGNECLTSASIHFKKMAGSGTSQDPYVIVAGTELSPAVITTPNVGICYTYTCTQAAKLGIVAFNQSARMYVSTSNGETFIFDRGMFDLINVEVGTEVWITIFLDSPGTVEFTLFYET